MTAYAADPAAYGRAMGRLSARLAAPFLAFADVPDGSRVLDLGCGTGNLADALAVALPASQVIGLDIAEGFLAAARLAAPAALLACGDAMALPFACGSFDAGLAMLVLSFPPAPAVAAAELARVVRPRGIVAAAMWEFTAGMPLLRLLCDSVAAAVPGGEAVRERLEALPLTRPGTLAEALASAGLAVAEEREITITVAYDDSEAFWQAWSGGAGVIGPFLAALPAGGREAARAAIREAYRRGGADGPRSFPATAIAVRAIKPP